MMPESSIAQPKWRRIVKPAISFLPFLAFFLAVLFINRDLFRTPIFEDGDLALNALQVQRAKHFHELLGNYSRFHFHHPGPAFFYIFAVGEAILRDWLHAVPTPMNAHVITLLFVNMVFLWLIVRILRSHCPSPLLAPACILATVAFVSVVNHAITNGALVSIWMPYAPLFCFLLFAVACGSVAAGKEGHMPIAAAAGMMLIHAHVAQGLFVSTLGAGALLLWFRRGGRKTVGLKPPLYASAIIIAIFSLPILVEPFINHPSNLQQIREYMAAHPGFSNGPILSIKYFASFLLFAPTPETTLLAPSASLWKHALEDRFTLIYWGAGAALGIAAIACCWRRLTASRFVMIAAAEIFFISALFVFWGMKISGPLYNFNGFFIYSIQLYALLLFAAVILRTRTPGLLQTAAVSALLYVIAGDVMWQQAPFFRNAYWGGPDQMQVAAQSLPGPSRTQLVFDTEEWVFAAGTANQLAHMGKDFCVSSNWVYAFGPSSGCQGATDIQRMFFSQNGALCERPCSRLAKTATLSVELRPLEEFRIPISIGLDETQDMKDGFYGVEGGQRWAKRAADIRFATAANFDTNQAYLLEIAASNVDGRPATVTINGRGIGSFDHIWMGTARFRVAGSVFRAGCVNVVSFQVPNAGPLGADPRELGFSFRGLRIIPVSTQRGDG